MHQLADFTGFEEGEFLGSKFGSQNVFHFKKTRAITNFNKAVTSHCNRLSEIRVSPRSTIIVIYRNDSYHDKDNY